MKDLQKNMGSRGNDGQGAEDQTRRDRPASGPNSAAEGDVSPEIFYSDKNRNGEAKKKKGSKNKKKNKENREKLEEADDRGEEQDQDESDATNRRGGGARERGDRSEDASVQGLDSVDEEAPSVLNVLDEMDLNVRRFFWFVSSDGCCASYSRSIVVSSARWMCRFCTL